MRGDVMVNLTFHFGGTMIREGEDYKYLGELGMKTVSWELYDISWAKFVHFSKHEEKIEAPIRFIWYKEREKEMKTVNYLFDESSEDMFLLICLAKEAGEAEIFLEYDCRERSEPQYLTSSRHEDRQVGDDETVNNFQENEDENYSDSDEEIDRPKEDEEPEQSEDEIHEEEADDGDDEGSNGDETVAEQGDANVDDGEDVVEDAGDGRNDDRFRSVFEEGESSEPVKEAYQNSEEKEAAERKAEESEEECVIEEDAEYPDTPLESDEE
ncbi:unnamed protein product [Microthlaspi erraticum]|uniref:Uncharacterized protein n=1 Tax=Microthlaspi erraticum TaxID=1685480 RepID=A0A6D2J0G5_9BRAS|nr:unnamed protein product [Microthlaspi erraticum]